MVIIQQTEIMNLRQNQGEILMTAMYGSWIFGPMCATMLEKNHGAIYIYI